MLRALQTGLSGFGTQMASTAPMSSEGTGKTLLPIYLPPLRHTVPCKNFLESLTHEQLVAGLNASVIGDLAEEEF